MSNRLLPYDTIIKAHEGDPIAIQAVLDRYAGYIRYFSKMNGYYNSDMLIKREGNKSYYYVAEESHQEEDSRIIMVEYGQNEEYTLHEIELEDYSENYAIANDKVYFLKDESVFYVEITTGKKTVVTSDYIYKDIRANNLGEVFFTAIDKKMNYIYGMIQKDGTLSTTVKENSFDMLIVNPLN